MSDFDSMTERIRYVRAAYSIGMPVTAEAHAGKHLLEVIDFAADCDRMLASLRAVSFPMTSTVQISTTDPDAELFITEGTARLLHAALGQALALPAPTGMRADR